MPAFTIYHNPRCSKSRTALQLMQEAGHEPAIRLYLEERLSEAELSALLKKANKRPSEAIRSGEAAYKEKSLKDASEDVLLAAMIDEPKLIERPIVETKDTAVIARPPEKWEELL
ncbi:MAG: arsenate reductase (glutaredoxin) [Rickettsiales bacterium]|nr:arsenate reductase (glutaredoxin) [Rickettsiales bacterium]